MTLRKRLIMKLVRLLLLLNLLTLMLVATYAQPTLPDFGYENMKVNGQLSTGSRPLVLILADYAGGRTFPAGVAFYDSLMFDFFRPLSINGYFLAISNGRFSWSRGGVVGPLSFSAEQRQDSVDPRIMATIVLAAMNTGFNFAQFDGNSDGLITNDEIGIFIISNKSQDGLWGVSRWANPLGVNQPYDLTTQGSTVSIRCKVSAADHTTSFMTMCHELSHELGTLDLYGASDLSQSLTLMGATIYPSLNDLRTYHLDPWHKMQLGWSEPRIRSLRESGIEGLPATQMIRGDAPVILYDPQHGINEFFIIEYRTPSSPNGSGYDTNVADTGLAIWHVNQDGNKNPIPIPNVTLYAIYSDGAPNFTLGGNTLWGSEITTPLLRWLDNSQTQTKIFVRPFNAGAADITVEWFQEFWVDFNYTGSSELGTFDAPFKTLAGGVTAIPTGGVLKIKTGSSNEVPTISKKMKIEAYGGNVTIGH